MKKGILVYDRNDAEYNKWFIERIITEGAKEGLDIKLMLTEELSRLCGLQSKSLLDECDFAIMRNRNFRMSEILEGKNIHCFNSSYVCRIGNDKWEMYRDFNSAGIPVMYTQTSRLPFPFVMKPRDGHGGRNVFLVSNKDEYEKVLGQINGDEDKYIYQFAASERGRDIRVYVCGDTILTAMERVAGGEGEFRANFSLGGTAKEHALTDEELKLAAKAADHIKADFVGIDIIYNNGNPVINEVEDAVGTRMLYSETDLDAVRIYIEWIAECVGKELQ